MISSQNQSRNAPNYADWNNRALEDRLLDLSNEASAIRATAERQGRDLTESEAREVDRILAAFEEVENELGSRGSRGRKTAPNTPAGAQNHVSRSDSHGGVIFRGNQPAREVFGRAAATDWGGFRNAAEFFMALKTGKHPNLYGNAMTEGVGSDGGYYVPSTLVYSIYDRMIASAEIFQRCLVIPTDTNNASFPMLDDLDRTTSLGGLRGQWMGELAEGTKQKGKYQLIDMKLNKLGVFCEASNELLEDAQALANQLVTDMGQSLALDLDEALLRGNGVGKPLGLLNAPSTIPIAKENGQAAGTIVYENVLKMWARVHPSAQVRGVWMCSPSALPQILTMVHKITDAAGSDFVGGSPVFVVNASGDTPMTIFGRPLIVSELCSQVGSVGDLIFADWSRYLILAKRSWRMDVSNDVSFMTDASVYRLIARVAGQPMLSGPITPRYGAETLTWATVLEARS